MCGLLAFLGPPSQNMLDMFEVMFTVDIVRGRDSCGVAAITPNEVKLVKSVMYPLELMRTLRYQEHIINNINDTYCYIGHNRAATKGDITRANAHPFIYGHIIGAHNGTLWKNLEPEDGKKFDTDSQSIFYSIAKHGIEWTWKNLDGAAALVWYDRKEETLNFITNGKRPLFFLSNKQKSMLMVSSEKEFIMDISYRAGVRMEADVCWKPADDMLFSFKYNNKTQKLENTTTKLEHKSFLIGNYGTKEYWSSIKNGNGRRFIPYGAGIDDDDYVADERVVKENPTVVSSQENTEKDKKKTLHDLGFNAAIRIMTKKEFYRRYKRCYLCATNMSGEYKNAIVIDEHIAVCEECAIIAVENNMPLNTSIRGV